MDYSVFNNSGNLQHQFFTAEDILRYVSEEEIFELVFGYQPEELDRDVSPFRNDNEPGCIFSRDPNGKLRFIDFGNNNNTNGIKASHLDCFDAVRLHFKLKNFRDTLLFIKTKLIDSKGINLIPRGKSVSKISSKSNKNFSFDVVLRDYQLRDKYFWGQFGITKENLLEDKVYPVIQARLYNTKKGDMVINYRDIAYVYTDFASKAKKLYSPLSKNKFTTDCVADDLSGETSLPPSGKKLIITKSYKDYRVLKNAGLTTVWVTSETTPPSDEKLVSLCSRFESVLIIFDNDSVGIFSAAVLKDKINSLLPGKANYWYLPENLLKRGIKDPADYFKKFGRLSLLKLLQINNVF